MRLRSGGRDSDDLRHQVDVDRGVWTVDRDRGPPVYSVLYTVQ